MTVVVLWRKTTADYIAPDCGTPLVTYLCSEACQETHEIYSVGGGRFARVFIGLAPGYFAGKGAVISAEEIQANLDQIRNPEGYIIPASITDEMKLLMKAFSE